jgi:hypothetical protein
MSGSPFVFDHLTGTLARASLGSVFVLFSAYTVAYVLLLGRYRLPRWTGVAGFLAGKGQPWFRLLTFCQACAFLTPLCFTAFAACLAAAAAPRYQAVAFIGLSAAVAFSVLSSVHYFVQFALAGAGPEGAGEAGLGHLFQLNPGAVIAAVNLLGWTVFFALACFALAPLLAGSTRTVAVGALLAVNGVVCVLGAAGYLLHLRALNVLYFNGMGLAVLGFSLAGVLLL